MELEGTRTIAASRETVWARLNDAETLAACIPGCEDLTGDPESGFQATVKQKVGPVKATFRGGVAIENADPPNRYRLAGEGKGGVAGFAKGHADVVLTEVPEGTELAYRAEIRVGGKLAQLGSRVIGGFATRMTEDFFERFKDRVEAPDGPDAAGDGNAAKA